MGKRLPPKSKIGKVCVVKGGKRTFCKGTKIRGKKNLELRKPQKQQKTGDKHKQGLAGLALEKTRTVK